MRRHLSINGSVAKYFFATEPVKLSLTLLKRLVGTHARILYSSKDEEVEAVKQLQAQGFSLRDVLQEVVKIK